MSRETIIGLINRLANQLLLVKSIQVVSDFFFIYLTYCILISGDVMTFFGREFTQSNALIIVILVSVINLCLSLLQRSYRRSGRELAEQLDGDLTDAEQRKVKLFY